MYLSLRKLIYTISESIIVSTTYKQMQFRHVSETVNKMPFLPAMIPDKMRLFCTQFDGGAVVVLVPEQGEDDVKDNGEAEGGRHWVVLVLAPAHV